MVQTKAHATRLLIENSRAVGVEYHTPAGRRTARVRREIVVSGGVYGSPQLLLLSGLGPAAHLQAMGIAVLRDMPVGDNLHDHFNTYLAYRCSKSITLNELQHSLPRRVAAAARYALFRNGPMSNNGLYVGAFFCSTPLRAARYPDEHDSVEHEGAHPHRHCFAPVPRFHA